MKKGVNVIIMQDRKALVLKRSSSSKFSPNLWDLPGGKVEPKENLKEAVVREAKEETGLEVKPKNNYFYIHYYPDNSTRENAEMAIYAFETELIGGKVKLSQEHSDFKWVSRSNWKELDYTSSVRMTLKRLF